jgi:hypothetical protein
MFLDEDIPLHGPMPEGQPFAHPNHRVRRGPPHHQASMANFSACRAEKCSSDSM